MAAVGQAMTPPQPVPVAHGSSTVTGVSDPDRDRHVTPAGTSDLPTRQRPWRPPQEPMKGKPKYGVWPSVVKAVTPRSPGVSVRVQSEVDLES